MGKDQSSSVHNNDPASRRASQAHTADEVLDLTTEVESEALQSGGGLVSRNFYQAQPGSSSGGRGPQPTPLGTTRVPPSLPRASLNGRSPHFPPMAVRPSGRVKATPIVPGDPDSSSKSKTSSPYGPGWDNDFNSNGATSSHSTHGKQQIRQPPGFRKVSSNHQRREPAGAAAANAAEDRNRAALSSRSSLSSMPAVPRKPLGATRTLDPRSALQGDKSTSARDSTFHQSGWQSDGSRQLDSPITIAVRGAATHSIKGKGKAAQNVDLTLSDNDDLGEDEIENPDEGVPRSARRLSNSAAQHPAKRQRLTDVHNASSPDPLQISGSSRARLSDMPLDKVNAIAEGDASYRAAKDGKQATKLINRMQPKQSAGTKPRHSLADDDDFSVRNDVARPATSLSGSRQAKTAVQDCIVEFPGVVYSFSESGDKSAAAPTEFVLTDHQLLVNIGDKDTHRMTLRRRNGNEIEEILCFKRKDLHMVEMALVDQQPPIIRFHFNHPSSELLKMQREAQTADKTAVLAVELVRVKEAKDSTELAALHSIFTEWQEEPNKILFKECGAEHARLLYESHRHAVAEAVKVQAKEAKKPAFATSTPQLSRSGKRIPAKAKNFSEGMQQTRLPFAQSPAQESSLRRSSRATTSTYSQAAIEARAPLSEADTTPADKVVLSYPFDGVTAGAAVSITHGDTKRLQDDEFLNDTLIEFGLKRIFVDLVQEEKKLAEDQRLSDRVHMFNSFFYKRLTQRKATIDKDGQKVDQYAAVRKWTQKFDLFAKRFVIIPINEHLHWYLAIVVNPGAILAHTTDHGSATAPRRTRQSAANESAAASGANTPEREPTPPLDGDARDGQLEAEKAAEEAIQRGIALASSRTEAGPTEDVEMLNVDDEGSSSGDGAEKDADGDVTIEDADTHKMAAHGDVPLSIRHQNGDSPESEVAPQPHASGAPSSSQPIVIRPSACAPGEETPERSRPSSPGFEFVEVSSSRKAAEKDDPLRFDDKTCYVLTFDSLGGKHEAVARRLRSYLVKEALDKKGLFIDGKWAETCVVSKTVSVPQQSNYSDCGLYVLHFVEQFLSHSQDLEDQILKSPPSSKTPAELKQRYLFAVNELWNAPGAQTRRQRLREDVKKMSEEYALHRAPIEEAEAKARDEKAKRKQAQREKDEAERSAALAIQLASETADIDKAAAEAAAKKERQAAEEQKAEESLQLEIKSKPKGRGRGKAKGKQKQMEVMTLSSDEDDDDEAEEDGRRSHVDDIVSAALGKSSSSEGHTARGAATESFGRPGSTLASSTAALATLAATKPVAPPTATATAAFKHTFVPVSHRLAEEDEVMPTGDLESSDEEAPPKPDSPKRPGALTLAGRHVAAVSPELGLERSPPPRGRRADFGDGDSTAEPGSVPLQPASSSDTASHNKHMRWDASGSTTVETHPTPFQPRIKIPASGPLRASPVRLQTPSLAFHPRASLPAGSTTPPHPPSSQASALHFHAPFAMPPMPPSNQAAAGGPAAAKKGATAPSAPVERTNLGTIEIE